MLPTLLDTDILSKVLKQHDNNVLQAARAYLDEMHASAIYADWRQRGELIGDADILIAATALEHGLVLATGNVAHFGRIPA